MATAQKDHEEKRYKAYITDAIKALLESLSGEELPRWYADKTPVEKEEDPDDVIERIMNNIKSVGK